MTREECKDKGEMGENLVWNRKERKKYKRGMSKYEKRVEMRGMRGLRGQGRGESEFSMEERRERNNWE